MSDCGIVAVYGGLAVFYKVTKVFFMRWPIFFLEVGSSESLRSYSIDDIVIWCVLFYHNRTGLVYDEVMLKHVNVFDK